MLDIFDSIFDYSYNLTKFVELKKYLMNNLIDLIDHMNMKNQLLEWWMNQMDLKHTNKHLDRNYLKYLN